VLLRYAAAVLANRDDLAKAVAAHAGTGVDATLALELWRDDQRKSVADRPGPLGVTVSPDPPAVVLASLWDAAEAVRARVPAWPCGAGGGGLLNREDRPPGLSPPMLRHFSSDTTDRPARKKPFLRAGPKGRS
jgi:hypothetical protein